MAPLYDGLIDASLATGDPKFVASVLRAGHCVAFKTRMSMYHADGHAAGRVWLRLYLLSGSKDPSQLEPWVKLFTYLAQNPITQELRFRETPPHGLKVTDRWVWADALYMSPPTIVVLYQATGDDSYLRFMDREFRFAYDSLYDPEEKLFYRDDRFIGQRSPEGEKIFWSRANGWVLAGLALMLESLPTDYPTRPFYLNLFQEMSRSIAALQGPDGFWNPSLGDPAYVPQPETSGTALFVRALASGVRQGLLDPKTYWPAVQRGWNAMQSVIGPDGEVTWCSPSRRSRGLQAELDRALRNGRGALRCDGNPAVAQGLPAGRPGRPAQGSRGTGRGGPCPVAMGRQPMRRAPVTRAMHGRD